MAARTGRFVRVLSTLATILCATAMGVAADAASSRIVYGSYLPASAGRDVPISVDRDGATWFAATLVSSGSSTGTIQRVAAAGGAAALLASMPSAIPTTIAVDPRGAVYVAGSINGDSFQFSPSAFQQHKGQGFVAKLSLSGAVQWTSFISAVPAAAAFDAEGSVYVTGEAGGEFRTTAGALKSSIGPAACPERPGGEPLVCADAFVAKISADGSRLIYATFLGGILADRATGIAVARDGSVFVTGETLSGDFPTTAGAFQARYSGFGDAFAIRLNANGSRLMFSTFLGGSHTDGAAGVILDANLNAYVTGFTVSRNFPVTANAWQSAPGGTASDPSTDAFFVKLDAFGSPAFSSYLGGPDGERAGAPALLSNGRLVFLTPGSAAALIERRKPGPCEPASTLVFIDPQTGRVADHYGLPRLTGSTLAVDSGGLIHVAGSTREASDQFALSLEPPPPSLVPYLVRVDLSRTDDLAPACLLNAASLVRSGSMIPPLAVLSVSPGEIVSIFGIRLGVRDGLSASVAADGTLPRELGGVRVKIGGRAVPLLAVSTREIRASVPYSAVPGPSEIVIERDDLSTGAYPLAIAPAASGIFTADGSGIGLAAAINQDGTLNGPRNPARRGSVVSLFATGLGTVAPLPPDSVLNPIAAPWPVAAERMELYFTSNQKMEILFAGPAPGQVPGVFQVNAGIPNDIPPGRVPVKLTFDPPGWNRSQTVYLFVE